MRILLQHTKTRLYLKSLGKWTANPFDALAFVDTIRAHDYSIYHRLSETSIVPFSERASQPAHRNRALAQAAV